MAGLLGASRADEVNDEGDDGQDQQNVNEECGDMEGDEAEDPSDKKHHRDG